MADMAELWHGTILWSTHGRMAVSLTNTTLGTCMFMPLNPHIYSTFSLLPGLTWGHVQKRLILIWHLPWTRHNTGYKQQEHFQRTIFQISISKPALFRFLTPQSWSFATPLVSLLMYSSYPILVFRCLGLGFLDQISIFQITNMFDQPCLHLSVSLGSYNMRPPR